MTIRSRGLQCVKHLIDLYFHLLQVSLYTSEANYRTDTILHSQKYLCTLFVYRMLLFTIVAHTEVHTARYSVFVLSCYIIQDVYNEKP